MTHTERVRGRAARPRTLRRVSLGDFCEAILWGAILGATLAILS